MRTYRTSSTGLSYEALWECIAHSGIPESDIEPFDGGLRVSSDSEHSKLAIGLLEIRKYIAQYREQFFERSFSTRTIRTDVGSLTPHFVWSNGNAPYIVVSSLDAAAHSLFSELNVNKKTRGTGAPTY